MQNHVKEEFIKYIDSLNGEFKELQGGSFAYINTGEIFTKTEVQKYIQLAIEKYSADNFDALKQFTKQMTGVSTDQRIINARSKNPKKKLKNKDTYEGGNFNIVYKNRLEELGNMKLNNNEKLVYYVLRDYAQYPTNCVVIKEHIPIMTELEPIIGLTERTIRKCLKSLEEKRLVKLIQYGHRKSIYINPEYYATGKDLDIETLKIFNLVQCDDEKLNSYLKDK